MKKVPASYKWKVGDVFICSSNQPHRSTLIVEVTRVLDPSYVRLRILESTLEHWLVGTEFCRQRPASHWRLADSDYLECRVMEQYEVLPE